MKGLILAAGHGTRLRPLTYTSNKHLIPIANKPLLFYPIEALKEAGITDIGIIVGHTEERVKDVKEAVGDGSKFGIKVTYIFQDAPRGLAHAVKVAKDFLTNENSDGKFVVHLGDNILNGGIKEYVESFKSANCDAQILLKNVKDPQRFGVAEIKDGRIARLVEKPKDPPSNLALVGVYMFNNSVFEAINKLKPSWRNELEITEAIQNLINSGKNVTYKIIEKGWWKDPGDPDGVLEANHLILDELEPFDKSKKEEGVTIVGKVGIEENTIIRRGTTIRGPVIIGKNCEIGPDAYIGPYSSVGDNCIIKNAEIESSILVGSDRIECKKRIVDSLIGKNVTIDSAEESTPKATKLILGENSFVSI